MEKLLPTLIVVILCSVRAFGNAEHELARNLIAQYPRPKFIRPVELASSAVPLQVGYYLANIVEFEESSAHLTVTGSLKLLWHDDYVSWNAEETGVRHMRFDLSNVWTPDLRSYQGMLDEHEDLLGVVFSGGEVLSVPPVRHQVQCAPEGTGSYLCRFNVGSWVYPQSQVALSLFPNSSGIEMDFFAPHPQWALVNPSAEVIGRIFSCCPDDVYESLEIRLHVTRVPHATPASSQEQSPGSHEHSSHETGQGNHDTELPGQHPPSMF